MKYNKKLLKFKIYLKSIAKRFSINSKNQSQILKDGITIIKASFNTSPEMAFDYSMEKELQSAAVHNQKRTNQKLINIIKRIDRKEFLYKSQRVAISVLVTAGVVTN